MANPSRCPLLDAGLCHETASILRFDQVVLAEYSEPSLASCWAATLDMATQAALRVSLKSTELISVCARASTQRDNFGRTDGAKRGHYPKIELRDATGCYGAF